MPSINITAASSSATGGGVPTNTGTAFVAGTTDQGPPPGGPAYVRCLSLSDYVNAFGPRSTVSAPLYDWLDEFFHDGGGQAYVARVTDNTATTASLTLRDASSNPTVKVSALTPGTDGNSVYIVVTTGSGNVTVEVEDSAGDILETHGPYSTQAALLADTSSSYVTFAQATGGGASTNLPAALSSTALSGGADANDLTDASFVSALASFPATLGPGTVALPGKTSTTAWAGLDAHALANNRWAAKDVADSSSAATVAASIASNRSGSGASYGMYVVGQAILPGIIPGTFRYCAGSACVAALRAQVAETPSQNQAPCGVNWPLNYPLGFTEFYGPAGVSNLPAGSYSLTDVQTLEAGGVNTFANIGNTLCLYGFVSPVPQTTDATYWQASAGVERMSLVSDCAKVSLPFQFQTIDGAGNLITAFQTALKGVLATHHGANALYSAGDVITASPVNTNATAAAGQLNANLEVQISPYVDTINGSIVTVPITLNVT